MGMEESESVCKGKLKKQKYVRYFSIYITCDIYKYPPDRAKALPQLVSDCIWEICILVSDLHQAVRWLAAGLGVYQVNKVNTLVKLMCILKELLTITLKHVTTCTTYLKEWQ